MPGAGPAQPTVHAFEANSIEGEPVALSRYRGKVLLIVNTASKCGFTPQYAALERLHQRYRDRGFEVLAFPANNFGRQEPGTDAQIQQFCSTKFGTSFPLFAKVSVKGKEIHPLFAYLTQDSAFTGDIAWNFTKFLVGADGQVAARFGASVDPESHDVTGAIERLLGSAAS